MVYLHHKQNRRIDLLLSTLLKIARDKVFEQLTKLEKGKYSHRRAEISKRHKSAVEMLSARIPVTQRDEECWMIPSQRDGSIQYTIRLVNKTCNCKLFCANCHACVHMYTCTCMDATIHATVCKHVHLVNIFKTTDTANTTSPTCTCTIDSCNTLEYFSSLFEDTLSTDYELSTLRLQVQQQVDELKTLVKSCQHVDALRASTKHLTSAITVIKVIETTTNSKPALLSRKRQYPPNKNSEKQLCFFSTKMRKLTSTQLSKPSYDESQKCKSHLLSLDTTVCGICFQEDDACEDDMVEWVQCNTCLIWLHMMCAQESASDNYTCNYCSTH